MEGAATPHFLWVVLMQGHQRKAVMDTWPAIRSPAQLGKQTRGIFIYFSSQNLGSYRKHPCSPASPARIHSLISPQRFRGAISVSGQDGLFLTSPLAVHLRRHTDMANINVYICIYRFRYKNGRGAGGGLSQHFAVP